MQRGLLALLLLFIFLVGIRGMGTGFKGLGKETLDSFFLATSNPFIGLFVGILGTTLVQSSSVTTSMIVAMVAAPADPLPVANAIPMIMGANIGTTVTNTIVALGHINRPNEFRRAFAAATCHDFFNFITVVVLLPLEIATGFLQRLSGMLATAIGTGGSGHPPNPIGDATKAVIGPIHDMLDALLPGPQLASVALIVISMTIIFGSLTLMVRTLRQLAETRLKTILSRTLDANAYVGILVGSVLTVMVQSSSITTSILVPLAGAGIVTLVQVFPITLGANVGTTITAILASMAAPPETARLAVQIALVHLLFNLIGILMIYPLPATRAIPLAAATRLADVAVRSKTVALGYVLGLFYGIPALLMLATRLF